MEPADTENRGKRKKHDKFGRFAALKKLKELKGSKNKYEVSHVENVYDVVDEKEYSKKVISRQDDDWIVDDDGSGYVEDGRDIFDDDLDTNSIAASSSKNIKSQSRKRKAISENAGKGNLQYMLSNMPSKKTEETNFDQDDILSELIQEIDDEPNETLHPNKYTKLSEPVVSEKQAAKNYMNSFRVPKPTKISITPKKINKVIPSTSKQIFNKEKILASSEVPVRQSNNVENRINVQKNLTSKNNTNGQSSQQNVEANLSDIDIEINNLDIDSHEIITSTKVQHTKHDKVEENINKTIDNSTLTDVAGDLSMFDDDLDMSCIAELDDTLANDKVNTEEEITEEQLLKGWNTMLEGSNNEEIPININIDSADLSLDVNDDGNQVFKFFWWDAFEDRRTQPGVVFFFGKTYCQSKKSCVSCCVAVRNIQRKIFVLPRQFHKSEPTKPVTFLEVYREFNNIVAANLKLTNFKSKKTTKNYAFDPTIPAQSEYLEVLYPAKSPPIPVEYQSGDTYSKIFGLNTSYLEIVLLDQNIMGPCWLEVVNPELVTNQITWCKLEINCSKVANLIVQDKSKATPPPPLVIATINLRTIIGQNTKSEPKNEIVMLSCLVQNKYHIDKQAPKPPFQQHFCVFARPDNMRLPLDIYKALQNYKGTKVQKMDSEKALLNYFIMQFSNIDPDLIVGHDMQGYGLDLLCSRIRQSKIHTFSKLSKLKRSEMPIRGKFEREVFCGRLVCDIKISAKELIRSRSYDLDTLCQKVLKLADGERINLELEDIPRKFLTSDNLTNLITITMQDTAYILKMLYELNVMPLALQITNIAGNVMSKTLLGGRSERNEFLLLHAFTQKDYIPPDKSYEKRNVQTNENGEASKSKRKKPTYSGGLVLDPKTGFYDTFILLMDFNSLYPSIIQEYNVCFTTILSNENGSCSFVADKNKSNGILPTEIRKLVESRRNVKKLMNNLDSSTDLYMQYNIRQMALKLTANSMYGCLGFSNSRFFAKDLAAFITQKGREILTNTKDTVEKMDFEVIYGDTDSIMINTRCLDYDEVFKVGNKIKLEINKLYRQVELDIDGVFKYLLLLKKKKYAAVTISKAKSGKFRLVQEHKGLDIVRRDWSQLSSGCGRNILNYILNTDSLEEKIENVQNHLIKIKNDLENNLVPTYLLTIAKQLTKNPREYSEKNALPHVQVALRYNKKGGKQLQSGDIIEYIICDDGTSVAATQRAYHKDEFNNSETLKIDIKYYLGQQIYPVISRLCAPIAGLDGYEIATWLGLDTTNFKKPKEQTETDENIQYNDSLKYRNCEPFIFCCYACKAENRISEAAYKGFPFLDKCSNSECLIKPIEYLSCIINQLTMSMHVYIKKFYKFEMTCEDPACVNDNNFITIKLAGKYSICSNCKESVMYLKYTAKDLYLQLSYFQNLFEINKNGKRIHVDANQEAAYNSLKSAVIKFLSHSGFNKVNLTNMFMPFIPNKDVDEDNVPLAEDPEDEEEEI